MTPDVIHEIAKKFVTARLSATPLDHFPGEAPTVLDEAYLIQDQAIDQWPDAIKGWKVGRIPEHLEEGFGIDRLAGPMFESTVLDVTETPVVMPMYEGGFGAVEAEFLAVIAKDAPAGKTSWTLDEARSMISDLRIGIEIASSPLSTINVLGPAVVVSDFGNNAGLMVGPSIANWNSRELDSLKCETFIEGQSVGTGGAFRLTGGYVRSVQFVLELAAKRGRPLRAGALVATGQTNGIHDVRPGQNAKVVFGDDGELNCCLSAVAPLPSYAAK